MCSGTGIFHKAIRRRQNRVRSIRTQAGRNGFTCANRGESEPVSRESLALSTAMPGQDASGGPSAVVRIVQPWESEPFSRVFGTLPPVGMERRRQEHRPCRRTPLKTILTCPSLSRTTSAYQAMLRGSTPVCSPPRILRQRHADAGLHATMARRPASDTTPMLKTSVPGRCRRKGSQN